MAYCPHCAAVLDPNLAMCASCGQLVNAAPPPVPPVVDTRPDSVRLAVILLLISWAIPLLLLAKVTADGRASTTAIGGAATGMGATGAACPQRAQIVVPGSRTAAQKEQ